MLVQLVDPAAYTPPYDHALATALVRAGAEVELITTASPDWDAATGFGSTAPAAPDEPGSAATGGPAWAQPATQAGATTYTRRLDFYRRSTRLPAAVCASSPRAAEHPAGLRRLRARPADLTHVQWAPVQELDQLAFPRLAAARRHCPRHPASRSAPLAAGGAARPVRAREPRDRAFRARARAADRRGGACPTSGSA
ncbi:MAG: hypothetical protein PGN13_13120 [Patulibacter minatonensis]